MPAAKLSHKRDAPFETADCDSPVLLSSTSISPFSSDRTHTTSDGQSPHCPPDTAALHYTQIVVQYDNSIVVTLNTGKHHVHTRACSGIGLAVYAASVSAVA
jgi:hypothetical protein